MMSLNLFERACTIFLLLAITAIVASAQTFTTLALFDGTNGYAPGDISLVQGFDGNFYGTTFYGGPKNGGSLFKVSPTGTLTGLHGFCGDCTGGFFPEGPLALGSNGDFYGTTENGAANRAGAIFRMTPNSAVTNFYSFCAQVNCDDGSQPATGLILASDGNFYGTAPEGGVNGNSTGTIFKITPNGTFTLLYSFCPQAGCADGLTPLGLVQASDGNFYGTTTRGGANGYGTAFKITSSGSFTLLHTFCGGNRCNGAPSAGLMQASDGNFYGTAGEAVFKMTPNGTLTTLYTFCSRAGCPDGETLLGGLVQASDGNFYGTALYGGAYGSGTVFRLTPEGAVTVLYNFCPETGCADGEGPAGLVQGTDGIFYGTTQSGGGSGSNCSTTCGTIYSLSVGLGTFVKALPNTGRATQTINILGQGLTGTSAVSFNGASATFTLESDTHLTAVVPAGATSGIVTVATPGGPLSTIVPFQVKP